MFLPYGDKNGKWKRNKVVLKNFLSPYLPPFMRSNEFEGIN